MAESVERELRRFFREHKVLDTKALSDLLKGRSYRSLTRDLRAVSALSSYSHAGRYHTLPRIARFDSEGLWHYDNKIGFSRYGTLRATIMQWVDESEAGCTYLELKDRVLVRIDNVLRELVAAGRIRREGTRRGYVYYSSWESRAALQREKRREYPIVEGMAIPETLIIEVLSEVLRGSKVCVDIRQLTERLQQREVAVSMRQVAIILELYSVKKTVGSK